LLSILRTEFLSLSGLDAVEIHGWLLGVAVAVERKNRHDPAMADRLIAELRESRGPAGHDLDACPWCGRSVPFWVADSHEKECRERAVAEGAREASRT
ncbi:MAG TPA: hypothetical protein VFD30_20425, partial [Terriglobia bacterium]|nr:hypothetical protein [Terriglobia bacterium]